MNMLYPFFISFMIFLKSSFDARGSRNLLVVEHGYHGHTQQSIEISPYKFDHKGGEGESRPCKSLLSSMKH